VSKQWTKLSTPICRSRYVRLNFRFFKAKIGPDEEEVQVLDSRSFYSIFRSSDDLPWSYCTLRPWTRDSPHAPSYDLTRNEILQFVRAFGSHIRKIELGGDDSQIIMKIISSIPNVEEVNLTCDEEDMDAPVRVAVPVGRNFQLHRLKRICSVEIYGEAELNFLETLLNSAASPLDYVSLDLCGGEGVHEKKLYENSKIPLLLKGAVSISLRFSIKFRYAVRILSACAFNKLCISKLDVDFGGAGKRNEHTAVIGLFEDALQNLSTHLRKLRCRLSRPAESPALVRLPHLPVLKQLELEEYPSGRMYPGMSIHILHPFTTNQFPVLERIVIGPIFDPRRLFESACLDSVTQLTTKGTLHSMRSVEIDRVFPNLKTLHGCEVDGSDLEYIFTYITRLVHLGVEIDLKKEDHDLNVILSGISDPDHANYKWVPQQIEEYRAAHPRPSLLSMTCKFV